MRTQTLIAVFGSHGDADAARSALMRAGFDAPEVTLSIDLARDGIAAEAPGQAYENQKTEHGSGIEAWLDSSFASIVDEDTAQARRMADIQRGAAVLTLEGHSSRLQAALPLLQPFNPLAVRRTA